jgi:hypothetical protein
VFFPRKENAMQQQGSIAPDGVYDDGALYLVLGLAPATLAQARRSGALRFTRKGRRTLYIGQWVLDWLKADSEGKTLSGTIVPTASQTTRWERLKTRAWNNRLVVAFLAVLSVIGGLVALGSGLQTLFNWARHFKVWLWP